MCVCVCVCVCVSLCVCVCVCVCMCVCVCWERERERERAESFPRPAYPQIHLSALQTARVRIFRFMTGLFSLFCLVLFFVCLFVLGGGGVCLVGAPPINQIRSVNTQRTMFSIIYLLRTVCELTFSIKQMHYKTGTLWHSDASILFMSAKVPSASAKVVLDKRP